MKESVNISRRPVRIGRMKKSDVFRIRLACLSMLLCAVPVSPVHARAPTKATVDAINEQLPSARVQALAQGKNKVARKGLSGKASYYANRFHGRKTASGRIYHKEAMTAAHRSLPLGTWVRVINQQNGSTVIVQITDRGPFSRSRVIDLSRAAAEDLGMLQQGIAPVHLEVLPEYAQAKSTTPLQEFNELNEVQLASGY